MRAFLLVLVSVVGCAKPFMIVPDSEWKTVPASERTTMDRQHATDVARAQQEHDAARAALAAARKTVVTRVESPAPAAIAPGDEWAASMKQFETRKRYAMTEVATATADWQRARLAFYEQRVALASARLDVLSSTREMERARAVDHHRLGFDKYESAEFQGQLADTQQQWYAADQRAKAAREALTAATARVAAAKNSYAELVRIGPNAPTSDAHTLQLADWDDKPLRVPAWRERKAASPQYLKLGARVAGK